MRMYHHTDKFLKHDCRSLPGEIVEAIGHESDHDTATVKSFCVNCPYRLVAFQRTGLCLQMRDVPQSTSWTSFAFKRLFDRIRLHGLCPAVFIVTSQQEISCSRWSFFDVSRYRCLTVQSISHKLQISFWSQDPASQMAWRVLHKRLCQQGTRAAHFLTCTPFCA